MFFDNQSRQSKDFEFGPKFCPIAEPFRHWITEVLDKFFTDWTELNWTNTTKDHQDLKSCSNAALKAAAAAAVAAGGGAVSRDG